MKSSSILQKDPLKCYLCGAAATETHHIFGGANRAKSDKYGLTVRLCHWCHNEPPNGAHYSKVTMDALRRNGQRAAMDKYSWDIGRFVREFGKNYL